MSIRYSVVFVCQGGDLEAKSMLLAASLRAHLMWRYEMIAAIPGPDTVWRQPRPETLAFLRELGASIVPIENRIARDYPIGNKVACLGVETDADVKIFMDSDMLCLRPCEDDPVFSAKFCAKVADLRTFPVADETWREIYTGHGLSMPDERVRATVSGDSMPPYFNAGFIAVRKDVGLGGVWEEICRQIDSDPRIPHRRPWLDQIALPVAVRKLRLNWTGLAEEYNFPSHLKETPQTARFAHYHWPQTLMRSAVLRKGVDTLLGKYPDLEQAFAADPGYCKMLCRN